MPNFIEKKLAWTKNVNLKEAHGASLYDVGRLFLDNLKDIRLGERAAAISFNFLLGIPPSLIFIFSLVPFLPLDQVQETILQSLSLISPSPKFYETTSTIIIDFMETKQRELLSFGFLATIFVSSNGVMGLLRSFDRKSPALVERSSLSRRWKAIKLTMILMLVMLLSVAVLVIQSNLLKNTLEAWMGSTTLPRLVSWLTLILILYITLCIVYKYGPSINKKFRFFSLGAGFSTLAFILVTWGFFFIAANFLQFNKVYGSIGTLLMFMAWMFITGMVLLIGFELNLAMVMTGIKQEQENKDLKFPS